MAILAAVDDFLFRSKIRAVAKHVNAEIAFAQTADDIPDVVASSEELGKTAGKDQIQQKATYPAIHGLEASRARARDLIGEADTALAALGPRAEPIRALGRFILERKA